MPELSALLGSELPSGQQQPHSTASVGREEHAGGQRPAQGSGSLCEQVQGVRAELWELAPAPSTPVPVRVPQGAFAVWVGGGWVVPDEYMVENDPGRGGGCGKEDRTLRASYGGQKRGSGPCPGRRRTPAPPCPSGLSGSDQLEDGQRFLSWPPTQHLQPECGCWGEDLRGDLGSPAWTGDRL